MRRVLLAAMALVACRSSTDAAPPQDAGTDAIESCHQAPTDDDKSVVVATAPYVRYVDPFIGTGGVGFGTGSAYPGPQRPFGMARPGPDTSGKGGRPTFAHCSGYAYEDGFIVGFSQTRMHGTGIVDYGTVGLMPTLGMTAAKTTLNGRRVAFSHAKEKASPGFYSVQLDDGISVELTATEHVALHRYTFPKGADAAVLIDVGHWLPDVKITDGDVSVAAEKNEVSGFAHFAGGYSDRFGGMPVYFVARFARPFAKSGVWKGGTLAEGETSRKGGDVGAWATFDVTTDAVVGVAIGISFIDVEHARKNLDAEAKTFDFEATRKATEASWEALLSRLQLEARSPRDLEIAYTALYHTLLMPTLASETGGAYRGLDKAVHVAEGFRYYTDLSLWDTFRTLHPFMVLLYPEYQRDFLRSMVAMMKASGAPPKWPLGIGETGGMVGDSSAIVFGDSYEKGLRDFDLRAAYDVLKKSGTEKLPNGGRDHVEEYAKRGYVPIEAGGASGSVTLEYAYDDASLALLADALGEKADADAFRKRASSWKNLWDKESGFLLARRADGSFPRDDDKTLWQKYWAEGTTWQYTWYVPHDVAGLAEIMGGRDRFFDRLDELFALSSCQESKRLAPKPYYWHSNEVVLFVPWAYAELDDAKRTAKWVRWALENEYGDGPDGLPGNDDGGTMSAWWLFAALGVFPRVGGPDYLIGAPIFSKATLKLPGGDLTVLAKNTSKKALTPVSVTWNGAKLARPRIDHAALAKGGTLEIDLQ